MQKSNTNTHTHTHTLTHTLFAFIILLLLPLASQAHVHLDKSHPMKDQAMSSPPTAIQLWFSGKVEAEWSKVIVKDAHGQRVDNGDVTSINNDAKTVQVNLKTLSAGKYDVTWNVVAGDGHRIKGGISFNVE